MARKNNNLNAAKAAKDDEFYTQISDIEKEMKHYKHHFKDKVVFCNCDDPYESNFFKYFAMNFNHLGLKKLITTCYAGSLVMYTQLGLEEKDEQTFVVGTERKPYKIEINEVKDENNDGAIDLSDVEYLIKNKKNILTLLKGDGDFRSDECISLLKESDIVVTNPPFSLFRAYIAQLIEHEKKFLIIGGQNAITYKEVFPLLKDNKIWIGYNAVKEFKKPDGSTQKFGNICWYTNLDISKRHDTLPLYKYYSEDEYPKYDEYDAINVGKLAEIPCDYYEPMGVPITFMNSYNPEQFEILGNLGSYGVDGYSLASAIHIEGKKIFKRILIKRR